MIYDTLSKIDNETLFRYLGVMVAVVYVLTKVIDPSAMVIVGLIMGGLVVYYLNDKKTALADDFNKDMEYKLKRLRPRPEYFHLDIDVIEIFYNIREMRQYNQDSYDKALMTADNLLHLKDDVVNKGVEDCKANIDVARDMMNNSVNYLHSTIFTTPLQKVTTDKLTKAVEELHLVLRRIVDDMVEVCRVQYPNLYVENEGERPHDPRADPRFHFYV